MIELRCISCGAKTDICYTDSGTLGLIHRQCQCRACYIRAGHPECSECKQLLDRQFKYCPWCGKEL